MSTLKKLDMHKTLGMVGLSAHLSDNIAPSLINKFGAI